MTKPRPRKAPAPRRIALVGTAPSSVHAPFADESWEIWGVGFRGEHFTRADRWFELHRLDGLRDGPEWRPLLEKWAKDCELVMMWPEPLGPKVTQYPLDAVKDRFGTFFMTSSFAWMLALVLHEHLAGQTVAEIGVWGVDMEFGTEHREQRAGFRHFLALARFAGLPTRLLVNSGVIYEPVPYPFWQDCPQLEKLKRRKTGIEAEMQAKQRALDATSGRLSQIRASVSELRGIAGSDGVVARYSERITALEREEKGLAETAPGLRADVAYCRGALEEIDWHVDYLKP